MSLAKKVAKIAAPPYSGLKPVVVPFLMTAVTVACALWVAHLDPSRWRHSIIGQGPDPYLFVWFLKWWPYTLSHGLNPFVSFSVWAPGGMNLAWTTSVPGLAFFGAVWQPLVGVTGEYNLLMILGVSLSTLAMFALLRTLTKTTAPAVLGAFLYGFSPYMLGQIFSGHLNLVWTPILPLLALSAVNHARGAWPSRRVVILVALLMAVEFTWSTEIFATLWVMGITAGVLSWSFVHHPAYRVWAKTRKIVLLGALAGTVAVSPLIFYMLFHPGNPFGYLPGRFVISPLNWIIPSRLSLGGSLFTRVSQGFPENLAEQTGYIGVPVLVFLISYRSWLGQHPARRFLVRFFVVTLILALGPGIPLGHGSFPLPWWIADHLPALKDALPDRLMLYAFFSLALLMALFLADRRIRRVQRWGLGLAVAVTLMPSPQIHPSVAFSVPPLFRSFPKGHSIFSSSANNVLILPFSYQGRAMAYQAISGFAFNMSEGVLGPSPPVPYSSWPFVRLAQSRPLPDCAPVRQALTIYLASTGVHTIIATGSSRSSFAAIARHFPWSRTVFPGATVYRIGTWPVHPLPPTQAASQQALAAFSDLWQATRHYVLAGHPLSRLSPQALAHWHDLPECLIGPSKKPLTIEDTWVIPLPHRRIGIGMVGTWSVLHPIVARYGHLAREVDFPMMSQAVGRSPDLSKLGELMLVFPRRAFFSPAP